MNPPLPEYPASSYALHLQQLLLKNGVVDFEGEGKVHIEGGFFASGGGAMFGVLVAIDENGNEILLKAFSGSCMGGQLNLPGWVNHVVDEEAYNKYLTLFDAPIKELGRHAEEAFTEEERQALLAKRSEISRMALSYYRELYSIATIEGKRVRLKDIFPPGEKAPPTGSGGDCCAIKLLQYALTHRLRPPISMAEFFFGAPPTKDSGGDISVSTVLAMRNVGPSFTPCLPWISCIKIHISSL